jgi:uncharacterized protein YndB with AHSA1/START domain
VARTVGLDEPQVRSGDTAGSIIVTAWLSAPLDDAWRALTDVASVDQWFGALSGELVPGARVRLDFEDGDFFDLEVEEVDKPVIRWSWRFMGCGPRDAIELHLEESTGGCIVTVTDGDPGRGAHETDALGEGWRDFIERLQRYLATGARTRYAWRSEVEVWAELPVDANTARRVVIGFANEWLPLEPGARNLLSARALVLDDGQEPLTFSIEGVHGTGPASVAFTVRPHGIDGALPTEIGVAGRGNAAILAISQSGFSELGADDADQRRIRRRFASAWVAATQRARNLAQR